jgi:hypothetical protein
MYGLVCAYVCVSIDVNFHVKLSFLPSNPTPDNSEFDHWAPATNFPLDYMRIGNENGKSKDLLVMQKDLYPERANFWDEIEAHHPAEMKPKTLKGEL